LLNKLLIGIYSFITNKNAVFKRFIGLVFHMQEKTDFTISVIPSAVLEKDSKEKSLFSQEKEASVILSHK